MIPFLEKIADRLLAKFPDNMQNIAVVLPSKRAVVFLKHYLAKKISKPIFLADFYSIEEFIEGLSGLHILDNISLQFRLYRTYVKCSNNKKDSFDDFLRWSNLLLHDFNEVDRNLVDAATIYMNLSEVKELESWSVEDWSFLSKDLTLMQSDYLHFYKGMFNWYDDFSKSLLDDGLAYQGLAYKQAVERIKEIKMKWERVWFVGLNALTKSEEAIIDYLKKEDIARVFWDADSLYYDNELHEAGRFLRNQKTQWSEIDFKGVGDYYNQDKKSFNVIACPKNISQAKVASEILTGLSEEDLKDSNTAVVLADESLLYPVLYNLPSQVKKLNVTMGSPLKNTALFSFLETLFNVHVNALKYENHVFYYKDVIALVQHPYFLKLATQEEVSHFREYIMQRNIVFITQSNIKNIFSHDFIVELLSIWLDPNDVIKILNRLIGYLKRHLVGKSATVESEVLSAFFKNLIVLQNLLEENHFDIELRTLQVIMEQLVAKESIPFQGEPLEGVQLMGILESRTLDFKNVIVLSLNEGKLPKGKSMNSFIPYDIKKYFKLPTYTDSDAVFAYHFYRLLQRANNISLIHNSETDDFGSGERSRFITQLLSEYKGKIDSYVYEGPDIEFQSSHEIVINSQGLEEKIKSWALKGVSPSALNIYNNCSLHFYYHYLVGIRIDNEVDEYADASMMGTVIHDVLDDNYPIGILTDKYISDKTSGILLDIRDHFVKVFSNQAMKEGKNYLSLKIAQRLTKNFLKLERKLISEARVKNKNIKILSKELELFSDLLVDGVNFRLRGKIDRVDLEGDTLRIIDYKTGKVEEKELIFNEFDELINDPAKSKAFQLLMYAYLYLKNYPDYMAADIVAGNFSFKNLKPGLLKISRRISSKQSEILMINQSVIDEFELQLIKVLSKINHSSFSQKPHLKECEWCNHKLNFVQ